MRKETGSREGAQSSAVVCPDLEGPHVEVEGLPTRTGPETQPLSRPSSAPVVSRSLIPKQDSWADHLCTSAWSQRVRL